MNTEEEIKLNILNAYDNLKKNELYVRTNLAEATESLSSIRHRIYLKDETVQESGSFKFRGLLNQVKYLTSSGTNLSELKLITFSAANYGRTFAKMCSRMNIDGLVVMPDFAPLERSSFIESLGVRTERYSTNMIQTALESHMKDKNTICFHPFDDINLIYGHASFGLEILEDLPNVDVVVVSCGGGGILAGTALALKLFGSRECVIYGVEPATANTMQKSFEVGVPSSKKDARSIASGLSPPYAGNITFKICRKYVENIVVVSEEQILTAMVQLHEWGIKAEPSGAAGLAAVLFKKIPLLEESQKPLNVLIAVTGGNCSKADFNYIETRLKTMK